MDSSDDSPESAGADADATGGRRLPSRQDVERVRSLARADRGLAVVATARPDGSVHASVVNAGVLDHPITGQPAVGFVAIGGSAKLRYLRRSKRATLVFRAGWQWLGVEGGTTLIGPDDPIDGFASEGIPQLLRDIFTAAGGTHDNWAEYDRVMARERRAAVLIYLDRVYSNR